MDVFLPWRPARSRIPAFEFCLTWWESNGFTVHLVDSGDEQFSLAATRNAAVASMTADAPLVIADADTVGELPAILEALERTSIERRTILPYTEYRSLGRSGTSQALAGAPLESCEHFHWPPACSGLYVTTPSVWASYGGQDPRFKGWGPEDMAHLLAHQTLVGDLGRVEGHAFALGHDSESKSGAQHDANLALYGRYMAAAEAGPEAMKELIRER